MIFNEIFYENRQLPNNVLFVRQAGELLYDTDYGISRSGSQTHCIGFVKKGKLKLCFNNTDTVLVSGQSIFLPHNTEYSLAADRSAPPHFIWINLRGSLIDAVSDTLYGNDCAISDFDPTEVISRLRGLLRLDEDFKTQISELIFKITLEIFNRKISAQSAEDSRSDFELYMSNSIQNGFSVSEMARFFHCSTDTLNRQFRKEFGITPYAYYQRMRIEIAKAMLLETELCIDDIAERLHFNDRNHFSLYFKKAIGAAPVKYKNMNREDSAKFRENSSL